MQKQDAVELADRIMHERPDISVRVEHEGAYAPDSYAVQIVAGLAPETVTLTSAADWIKYQAGVPDRSDDWQGIEDEVEREIAPNPGKEPLGRPETHGR
jgi:hypothetical protein